jgi:hypothetical protein
MRELLKYPRPSRDDIRGGCGLKVHLAGAVGIYLPEVLLDLLVRFVYPTLSVAHLSVPTNPVAIIVLYQIPFVLPPSIRLTNHHERIAQNLRDEEFELTGVSQLDKQRFILDTIQQRNSVEQIENRRLRKERSDERRKREQKERDKLVLNKKPVKKSKKESLNAAGEKDEKDEKDEKEQKGNGKQKTENQATEDAEEEDEKEVGTPTERLRIRSKNLKRARLNRRLKRGRQQREEEEQEEEEQEEEEEREQEQG